MAFLFRETPNQQRNQLYFNWLLVIANRGRERIY
jgi:hypothetical protein